MRRKSSPQDSNSNDVAGSGSTNNFNNSHHHHNDPDYTPNKLRVLSSYSSSSSSNFHIDHGSSDYNLSQQQQQQQQQQAIPPPGECDSPGSISSEGLHHRKTHSSSLSQYQQQQQYARHPIQQANLLGDSSRISPDYLRHPLATTAASSATSTTTPIKKKVHQYYTTRKRTQIPRGGNNSNNNAKVGRSVAWKRIIQCMFIALIGGYVVFLHLAQNHYNKQNKEHKFGSGGGQHDYWPGTNKDESRSGSSSRLMKKDEFVVTSNHNNPPQSTEGGTTAIKQQRSPRKMFHQIQQNQQHHHDDTFTDDNNINNKSGKKGDEQSSLTNVPTKKKSDMHDYIFKQMEQQQQHSQLLSKTSNNKSINWSNDAFQKLTRGRTNRQKDRMVRTTPPNTSSSTTTIPLWYKLDHSSEETIQSIQQRWREDVVVEEDENDDNNADEEKQVDIASSSLCGSYAKEAAKHHPHNYNHHHTTQQQQEPLGSNSRVLITGILTPLGLHLALSLSRQCNVTNFMGLDTQFPNDALSRLEQNERLAVLKQELDGFGELHVPFMGLEVKEEGSIGIGSMEGKKNNAREKKLVELRNVTSTTTSSSSTTRDTFYARPYTKYGIPLTPGTSHDGSGSLDVILNYRPTHIVHLAGTQSDSLLNSNYHHHHTQGGGDDVNNNMSPPSFGGYYHHPVFQDKSEEEDDILQQTISSRPHLYDLRMGMTGMEQLLSGVVSQTMLDSDDKKFGRKSDLEKMQRPPPHVVYASSYDALHFRDIDTQLNPKVQRKKRNTKASNDDGESLGSISPQSLHNKRLSSRGLRGMSRLIDEIISSSYHALYNVPSIGLRFDAIYGPRGFGVPSTSIPIFHADRIKRTKRGVSPDVDLAETAVRSLYKKWTADVKVKRDKEAAAEEEEESDDEEEEEEEKEEERRRLSEEARHMSLIEESGWMHLAHDQRDFVFVEDAVGAIITAMQYKSVNNAPTTFNIGSGEMSNLATLAEGIQELATPKPDTHEKAPAKNVIDVEESSAARQAILSSNDYLRWSTQTSLKDGAARLLAWHMDRALPFFPPSSSNEEVDYSTGQLVSLDASSSSQFADEKGRFPMSIPLDGETILHRRGISSCSIEDDPTCLRELHTFYPCSSECSTQSCSPSVFDAVLGISHDTTKDCDVVMYTMALGYDVETMLLETEYSDGEEQEEWKETTVCTVAFVPSESTMVKNIIDSISPSSYKKRGVTPDSDYAAKIKALSGYIAHKGWNLILVPGTTEPLTAEDMFMPKLSPARLFHPTVRKAMFVDENFSHTPFPEDAQFLASETSRGLQKQRTVTGPDAKGHKTKYKLPEEPQRRAALLVSLMRKIPEADGDKMPLDNITVALMNDVGLDPEIDGEPEQIRNQREFYTQARSFINSMDLRSLNPVSQNKLEIKDFIRSKWIVHHLRLEEGHQLRCEWYREHVRWGTHLDQLSFAYVMAKRELTRKIITRQPLPAETDEELTILQRIIQIKSDAHEWHPIFSAEGAVLAIHHSQISPEAIPLNLQDLPENEIREDKPDEFFADDESTFYVRIMSDDRMLESRKAWMKIKANWRKRVAAMKEQQEE